MVATYGVPVSEDVGAKNQLWPNHPGKKETEKPNGEASRCREVPHRSSDISIIRHAGFQGGGNGCSTHHRENQEIWKGAKGCETNLGAQDATKTSGSRGKGV